MALLPDPTTAASERSSVSNKLTGSRRRGSGINRHRSRTFSETSLRGVQAQDAGASRESRGGPGGPRGSRRGQGGCRARASTPGVKGGSSRTNDSGYPPVGARRGLPRWFQPASSTSPWLFYQVLSEVFSKSSSVMSSLLFLWSPKSCKLQIVPASKRKQRRLSHGFVTGSYNCCT